MIKRPTSKLKDCKGCKHYELDWHTPPCDECFYYLSVRPYFVPKDHKTVGITQPGN